MELWWLYVASTPSSAVGTVENYPCEDKLRAFVVFDLASHLYALNFRMIKAFTNIDTYMDITSNENKMVLITPFSSDSLLYERL